MHSQRRARAEPLIDQVDAQLAAVAAERDRIAGELHDDSVQAMTAVSLQLQRLWTRSKDEADRELIDRARSITDTAIDRLRHMLFVLHPATLADDGLITTLQVYFESYIDDYAAIEWSVSGDDESSLPLGVSALGFRLAREAISNALRHADPDRIDVSVACDDNELTIVVIDDGSGFEPNSQSSRPGHLGMAHTRALAEAALGTHDVQSAPGQGTTVTIRLPIRA